MRRGEALAKVTIRLRLPARVEILEVDRSLGAPDRLAGSLVERDEELMIAAIEVHDQQFANRIGDDPAPRK